MIEVSFTEERDRGDGVALVRTVVCDRSLIKQYHDDLVVSLTDLVEQAQVVLRLQKERK